MKMKLYYRIVTHRVSINNFGKLGFKPFKEYVLTNDIQKHNYKKRIKFEECYEDYEKVCSDLNVVDMKADKIYWREY